MTLPGIAIAAHLLGVVWWIGGLAFVTLVFLPALRKGQVDDPHRLLDTIEHRFAPQARIAVLLACGLIIIAAAAVGSRGWQAR